MKQQQLFGVGNRLTGDNTPTLQQLPMDDGVLSSAGQARIGPLSNAKAGDLVGLLQALHDGEEVEMDSALLQELKDGGYVKEMSEAQMLQEKSNLSSMDEARKAYEAADKDYTKLQNRVDNLQHNLDSKLHHIWLAVIGRSENLMSDENDLFLERSKLPSLEQQRDAKKDAYIALLDLQDELDGYVEINGRYLTCSLSDDELSALQAMVEDRPDADFRNIALRARIVGKYLDKFRDITESEEVDFDDAAPLFRAALVSGRPLDDVIDLYFELYNDDRTPGSNIAASLVLAVLKSKGDKNKVLDTYSAMVKNDADLPEAYAAALTTMAVKYDKDPDLVQDIYQRILEMECYDDDDAIALTAITLESGLSPEEVYNRYIEIGDRAEVYNGADACTLTAVSFKWKLAPKKLIKSFEEATLDDNTLDVDFVGNYAALLARKIATIPELEAIQSAVESSDAPNSSAATISLIMAALAELKKTDPDQPFASFSTDFGESADGFNLSSALIEDLLDDDVFEFS